jgi:hypothetical protein
VSKPFRGTPYGILKRNMARYNQYDHLSRALPEHFPLTLIKRYLVTYYNYVTLSIYLGLSFITISPKSLF